MTLSEQITSLSQQLEAKRVAFASSAVTLPEQARALEAAATVLDNPSLISDLRSDAVRLNALVADLQARLAAVSTASGILVEAEVEKRVAARMPSLNERASQLAVEIMASVGQPVPVGALRGYRDDGRSHRSTAGLTGRAKLDAAINESLAKNPSTT